MIVNIGIIFFLSLPEAVLNTILVLYIAGERESHLKLNRANIIKMIVSTILMLFATAIIRPFMPNIVVSILFHIIAYTLIISIIYRTNFWTILFSTIASALVVSTIENIFVTIMTVVLGRGISEYMTNIPVMFALSLPIRLFQVLVIFFLKRYYNILEFTNISKEFRKVFIFCNLTIITAEYYISNSFVNHFSQYTKIEQILFAAAILIITITVNFLVFTSIYLSVKKVMLVSDSNYRKLQSNMTELEENAKYAFNEVYRLLKDEENVEQATVLLEKLLNAKGSKADT